MDEKELIQEFLEYILSEVGDSDMPIIGKVARIRRRRNL
jgi:hypothetical protein